MVLLAIAVAHGATDDSTSTETDYDNAPFFIDSVHSVASEVAKNTVVHDDKVVWSPFSVVNVLSAHNLTDNSTVLQNGFNSAIQYLEREQSSGLNITRIQFGYTKNKELVSENDKAFPMYPYPENDANLTDVIESKFSELTTGLVPNRTEEQPGHVSDDRLEIPRENVSSIYVTALGLRASWETPFHPRYARKTRFFLNSTHTTKVKYFNNIGFYKYARFPELDNSTAVAIPLKDTHKLYMIVLRPSTPEGIMNLSLILDQTQNLSEVLWARFRTRRVQLSMPKLNIDSQIPFIYQTPDNKNVTLMQLGSMTLTYSGITNNFTPDPSQRSVLKFTRLRRRKEDKKFFANSPFAFIIYDSFAGILNYGIVLNPTDHLANSLKFKPPPVILSPNGKLLTDVITGFTEKFFQVQRRVVDHQENFGVAGGNLLRSLATFYSNCRNDTEKLVNLNLPMGFPDAFQELYNYSSTPAVQDDALEIKDLNAFGRCKESQGLTMEPFLVKNADSDVQEEYINNTYRMRVSVPVSKRSEKRFYLNEVDYINASYVEYSGRVKYVSHALWDSKIIKVPTVTPQHFLYFLVPNERSGVHVIEEGLQNYPLSKLLCQMRVTNLRVRIPSFLIRSQNPPINLTELLGPFNGTASYENPKLLQDVTLEVGDVDMDGDLHENFFRNEDEDDDEEDDLDDESSAIEDIREPRKKGFRRKYRKVNLDRPFIVYVVDSTVGTVFMGRVNVANPVELEETPTSESPASPEDVEVTTIQNSVETLPPK
ncbi:Antichymotrypsin-2 [Orchesella cincta]|uniref:Antichymotrypsin-2 n=1 Tax=Orchesella cincta TaxID=48709 RepID=A0A1D2MB95_ORCCI|nr:Antichymotrypsin-2 [Orchesella cincta]